MARKKRSNSKRQREWRAKVATFGLKSKFLVTFDENLFALGSFYNFFLNLFKS